MEHTALQGILGNLKQGALVAASSGPVTEGHADYYHVWPRDAVLCALELCERNQPQGKQIIQWIIDLPTEKGLLLQRYEISGEPDPKGWCNAEGTRQLDQDALKFVGVSTIYDELSQEQKNKMHSDYVQFINAVKSKQSSTDVWEQKQGYFFYTTAALVWGVEKGNEIFGGENEVLLKELVESINHFYNPVLQSFVKGPNEKYVDLEIVLGINILLQTHYFRNEPFLKKAISSLNIFEEDLVVEGNGFIAPIRYNKDFWDGEKVGSEGIGRPWPMGCALLSQTYSRLAVLAAELNQEATAIECSKKANYWLTQLEKMPFCHAFPEQVDVDGHIPENSPKPLAWAAAEYLRAKRLVESH
ncbi:hypothetical protein HY991_04145 [Candidatus Micrarchaeota archaeon]|nr:hypothetical protein [Candidatus Micrarchaeota archaeon]